MHYPSMLLSSASLDLRADHFPFLCVVPLEVLQLIFLHLGLLKILLLHPMDVLSPTAV